MNNLKKKKIDLWIINLIGIIFCLLPIRIQTKNCRCKKLCISHRTTKNIKSLNIWITKSTLNSPRGDEETNSYPSSDLYEGSWNTKYLKAYSNLAVPDSFFLNISNLVLPVEGQVTSRFGPRGKSFHYGTDIRLQVGDTVRSAFDGKVRIMQYDRKGFGYYLVLRHFNGLETIYGHLSRFLVEQEQNVKGGRPIALGGGSGRVTGPHLHFEIRFLGVAIDSEEIIDFNKLTTKKDIYIFRKEN